MAEDSAKENSKEKLKFFKKADGDSTDAAVTVADSKEEPAETASAQKETPKEEQEAVQESGGADQPRHEAPGSALMPMVAPALALAVRTLVILAIVVADAYAAYFLVVKGIAPRMAEAQVVRAAQQTGPKEEVAEPEVVRADAKTVPRVGTITPIKDIVVNPAGSSGTRYLCTTVALESTKPLVADEVTEREPQIRDTLIEILSRRTVDELSALSTREELRAEIKTAVNDMLVSGEVVGVYLSNFVLQ
jgi:flagellar FliL protein